MSRNRGFSNLACDENHSSYGRKIYATMRALEKFDDSAHKIMSRVMIDGICYATCKIIVYSGGHSKRNQRRLYILHAFACTDVPSQQVITPSTLHGCITVITSAFRASMHNMDHAITLIRRGVMTSRIYIACRELGVTKSLQQYNEVTKGFYPRLKFNNNYYQINIATLLMAAKMYADGESHAEIQKITRIKVHPWWKVITH